MATKETEDVVDEGPSVPAPASIVGVRVIHRGLFELSRRSGSTGDYLLIDIPPRRPFRSPEDTLGDRLHTTIELGDHDCELVHAFIDALCHQTRLKAPARDVS